MARFAAFARATAACTAARSASGMGTSREVPATPLAGAFLPGLIAFQTAAIFLSHASATSLACAAGTSRKLRRGTGWNGRSVAVRRLYYRSTDPYRCV